MSSHWPDLVRTYSSLRSASIPRAYDRWIELAVPGVFEPTSDCSVFRCAGHPQLVAPVSMLMDRVITKLRVPILLAPSDKLEAVLVGAPDGLRLRLCMQLAERYKP